MGNRLHNMSPQLRKMVYKTDLIHHWSRGGLHVLMHACLRVQNQTKTGGGAQRMYTLFSLRANKCFEVVRLVPYFSLRRAAGTVVMEGELVLYVLQHKIEIIMYKVELILKSTHFVNPRWYTKTLKSKYSENVSSFIEHLLFYYYLCQTCSCCASNAT